MEKKKIIFGKIYVEVPQLGLINITDLPKDHYEYFLETMNELRHAYELIKQESKSHV